MCLEIKSPNCLIAEKDIICYKVLLKYKSDQMYHSPYWDFIWDFNTKYEQQFSLEYNRRYSIFYVEKGFHTIQCSSDAKCFIDKIYIDNCFKTLIERFVVVKCTIPKGSKYYKGRHSDLDCYASNQLIINEIIDGKEL